MRVDWCAAEGLLRNLRLLALTRATSCVGVSHLTVNVPSECSASITPCLDCAPSSPECIRAIEVWTNVLFGGHTDEIKCAKRA